MFWKKKNVPILMTPGPVPVPASIMDTLALPLIHHRTQEFESILSECLIQLKKIFKTSGHVFLHCSTGSGAMESSIVNTLSPHDQILSVVCGKFGERWTEMSKAYHLDVIEYKVQWGESFEVEKIKEILNQNPKIKCVMVQACETSTGALNPIQELGTYISTLENTILIVDAITALGATHLDMDAWGLDVVIGGSQKAFMLPTGLSMIGFSKKALAFAEKSKLPKYYFDILKEKKANAKSQTYFSSPVTLIRCLNTALDIILKYGMDNFIDRHEVVGNIIRKSVSDLGLKVFAKKPSPTVSAFLLPEGIDGEKVQEIMEKEYFVTIAGGQDHFKGRMIRIGHMGAIQRNDIEKTLMALYKTLKSLGHDCPTPQFSKYELDFKKLKKL